MDGAAVGGDGAAHDRPVVAAADADERQARARRVGAAALVLDVDARPAADEDLRTRGDAAAGGVPATAAPSTRARPRRRRSRAPSTSMGVARSTSTVTRRAAAAARTSATASASTPASEKRSWPAASAGAAAARRPGADTLAGQPPELLDRLALDGDVAAAAVLADRRGQRGVEAAHQKELLVGVAGRATGDRDLQDGGVQQTGFTDDFAGVEAQVEALGAVRAAIGGVALGVVVAQGAQAGDVVEEAAPAVLEGGPLQAVAGQLLADAGAPALQDLFLALDQ